MDEWPPMLPEVPLRPLNGDLVDVVNLLGATTGSVDGEEWREIKVFPVPCVWWPC